MRDSAVLLIDCPDRKGLVARVSGLLYERGANILHADQHQDHDLRLFFMRGVGPWRECIHRGTIRPRWFQSCVCAAGCGVGDAVEVECE